MCFTTHANYPHPPPPPPPGLILCIARPGQLETMFSSKKRTPETSQNSPRNANHAKNAEHAKNFKNSKVAET